MCFPARVSRDNIRVMAEPDSSLACPVMDSGRQNGSGFSHGPSGQPSACTPQPGACSEATSHMQLAARNYGACSGQCGTGWGCTHATCTPCSPATPYSTMSMSPPPTTPTRAYPLPMAGGLPSLVGQGHQTPPSMAFGHLSPHHQSTGFSDRDQRYSPFNSVHTLAPHAAADIFQPHGSQLSQQDPRHGGGLGARALALSSSGPQASLTMPASAMWPHWQTFGNTQC